MIIYLSNRAIVDSLIELKRCQMGNAFIPIQRLKLISRKIIFSNVSPTIPNSTLELYLREKLQLKLEFNISLLRINPTDGLFSHVISCRRQVYVLNKLEDTKLPSLFILDYSNTSQRIFIISNEHTCYKYQLHNHRSEECDLEYTEESTILDTNTSTSITDSGKDFPSKTYLHGFNSSNHHQESPIRHIYHHYNIAAITTRKQKAERKYCIRLTAIYKKNTTN
ncbi:hypothetical protein PGB90_003018 [Kerria lacca]